MGSEICCLLQQLLLQDTDKEAENLGEGGKNPRQGLAGLSRRVRRPSDHRASSSGTLRCSIQGGIVCALASQNIRCTRHIAVSTSRETGKTCRCSCLVIELQLFCFVIHTCLLPSFPFPFLQISASRIWPFAHLTTYHPCCSCAPMAHSLTEYRTN